MNSQMNAKSCQNYFIPSLRCFFIVLAFIASSRTLARVSYNTTAWHVVTCFLLVFQWSHSTSGWGRSKLRNWRQVESTDSYVKQQVRNLRPYWNGSKEEKKSPKSAHRSVRTHLLLGKDGEEIEYFKSDLNPHYSLQWCYSPHTHMNIKFVCVMYLLHNTRTSQVFAQLENYTEVRVFVCVCGEKAHHVILLAFKNVCVTYSCHPTSEIDIQEVEERNLLLPHVNLRTHMERVFLEEFIVSF